MSNVTITIAGRRYTIACAAGEETHIAMLGQSIDAKLAALPNLAGQSEARLLLYAALLLADEAYDAANPVARIEDEFAGNLEAVADRLETLAETLEERAHNP